MTTSTIHHRPAHRPALLLTGAAAVALAVGAVTLSVANHGDQSQPPAQHLRTSTSQTTPRGQHFSPTLSGGHVVPGP